MKIYKIKTDRVVKIKLLCLFLFYKENSNSFARFISSITYRLQVQKLLEYSENSDIIGTYYCVRSKKC